MQDESKMASVFEFAKLLHACNLALRVTNDKPTMNALLNSIGLSQNKILENGGTVTMNRDPFGAPNPTICDSTGKQIQQGVGMIVRDQLFDETLPVHLVGFDCFQNPGLSYSASLILNEISSIRRAILKSRT